MWHGVWENNSLLREFASLRHGLTISRHPATAVFTIVLFETSQPDCISCMLPS